MAVTSNNPVKSRQLSCGQGQPLLLIAGPCVLEDEASALAIAGSLIEQTAELPVELVFKASFDKANRTSIH